MADLNCSITKSYYFGMYNGKIVRTTADVDADELDAVREIAEQLPELDIEEVEGQFEDSFKDCYSHGSGHYTRDNRDWVEPHWTIGGVEMTASDLFDHLMAEINWFDKPLESTEETPEAHKIPLHISSLNRLVTTGTMFVVSFLDCKTGESKTMSCRQTTADRSQVLKNEESNLFTVYDVESNQNHAFPIRSIRSIKIMSQLFYLEKAV